MAHEQISIVVTPFFPFNKELAAETVKKLDLGREIKSVYYYELNDVTGYEDCIEKISSVIRSLDEKIIIVSFGLFSQVAGALAKIFTEKIAGVIFIEPDFTGQLYFKNYDPFFSFTIKRKFTKLFTNHKRVASRFLYKNKLTAYFNILKTLKETHVLKLADFINTGVKAAVIWNVMAKECWPLPQILSEEYDILTIQPEEDIAHFILKNDTITIDKF